MKLGLRGFRKIQGAAAVDRCHGSAVAILSEQVVVQAVGERPARVLESLARRSEEARRFLGIQAEVDQQGQVEERLDVACAHAADRDIG
ncbi:hypothetical protein ACWD9K_35785 [Streptomyces sp. 900116325]|uniref:hypothetical protein n=1 Tax=Streptomyces sp. NPDC000133 TaxID=3364535 RepID=UPI00369C7CA7